MADSDSRVVDSDSRVVDSDSRVVDSDSRVVDSGQQSGRQWTARCVGAHLGTKMVVPAVSRSTTPKQSGSFTPKR